MEIGREGRTMQRSRTLLLGTVLLQGCLSAGTIFDLSFSTGSAGVTCGSTVSSTVNSETMNIGPCTGPDSSSMYGHPYITASADPLQVSVDGSAAMFDDWWRMNIYATSEFQGIMEAVGGAGDAWLTFEVLEGGANLGWSNFESPTLGIDTRMVGFGASQQYLVPITFGEPIAYSILAGNSYTAGHQDIMWTQLSIIGLEVVDVNGVVIPGAQMELFSAAMLLQPSANLPVTTPEPNTLFLLLVGGGLVALGKVHYPVWCS